mgnify:FL=1
MPTTSYPYNIVITRDPLVLNKLFFDKLGRSSFSDAFSRLNASEKGKNLIVSPRSNNNFISLDVNFPDKVSGDGTKYVVLKLLETSKLLEYFNVSTEGFTEVMISRAIAKKAFLGPDKLLDDLSEGIRPRFFLSFGVGDNVQEWSGPYSLSLIDVNISITSDGVRELELMFTPTTDSLTVFSNKLFDDYQYAQKDSIFDGTSDRETLIHSVRNYKLKSPLQVGLTKAEAKQIDVANEAAGFDWMSPRTVGHLEGVATQPSEDWNYCVRNIVHAFIADRFPSVPNGNILVLLPDDFNDIVSIKNQKEKTIVDAFSKKLNDLGIDISLDYTTLKEEADKALKEELQVSEVAQAARINDTEEIIKAKSSKLKKLKEKKTRLEEELKAAPDDPQLSRIARANMARGYGSLKESTVQSSYKRLIKDVDAEILAEEESIKIKSDDVAARKNSNPPMLSKAVYMSQAIGSNVDDYTNPDLDLSKFTEFILAMGGLVLPSPEKKANTLLTLGPLYTFIKGINSVSGQTLSDDFTVLEENDAKILNLLKDSNIIESRDDPVIIFGRLATIRESVYPAVYSNTGSKILSNSSFWLPLVSPYAWAWTKIIAGQQDRGNPGVTRRNNLKFTWEKYRLAFIEAFKQKAGLKTSSFGEGLGDYYDDIKGMADTASTDNALIFTHNIKNSNVLSLSFDSSPYKGELLNYSTESVYKVLDGVFTKGELLADNRYQVGALGKLISLVAAEVAADTSKDKISVIQKALTGSKAREQIKLLTDGDSGSNSLDKLNAATFLDAVFIKAAGPKNLIKKGSPGRNLINEAETLRKMNKYIINVDIKTLPFFNTLILPGRKCILFGKPNLIKGASELRGKIENVPAFFTNAYTIIGYKHRITSTDAYSEFKLIQDSYAQGLTFKNLSFAQVFHMHLKESAPMLGWDGEWIQTIGAYSTGNTTDFNTPGGTEAEAAAARGDWTPEVIIINKDQ